MTEHLRIAANPLRGEASVEIGGAAYLLRPNFTALVAAEDELGPLLALVERAAAGQLRISELTGLLWHCLADRTGLERARFSEAVTAGGIAAATAPLRVLLTQILQGAG